jgi:outer membrane protein assembly factor BamB
MSSCKLDSARLTELETAPMHRLCSLAVFLLVGCGTAEPGATPARAEDTVAVKPGAPVPPDLGTRKTGADWPTFLGPHGTSVSDEKGIITPWPKEGLRIVWQKPTGIGYSMPTISRGRLFLFDRVRNHQRLQCWNAETAERLWEHEYPTNYRDFYNYDGGPRCSPVVDNDRVYIYGPEGMLRCLRVTDGKLVWSVDTISDYGVKQNFFGVGSTPVIDGDRLLVQVGGSAPGEDDGDFLSAKSNGSTLVAFDKYTGKMKYKTGNELASYASPVLTKLDGKRRCLVFARGGLLGLDPDNGKIAFQYPWRAKILESVNASNPVVVADRVLISECYGPGSALLEIKGDKVKEVWTDADKGRNKSLRCHWMTPIVVDGYVYGSSGRHTPEAELRCVELATGKVMWSARGLTRSSLLLVDGHFICLGEDGGVRLLRVNPKKYDEVSSVVLKEPGKDEPLLKDPCWAAPILSHGLLYVRGKDRLVCLELIR